MAVDAPIEHGTPRRLGVDEEQERFVGVVQELDRGREGQRRRLRPRSERHDVMRLFTVARCTRQRMVAAREPLHDSVAAGRAVDEQMEAVIEHLHLHDRVLGHASVQRDGLRAHHPALVRRAREEPGPGRGLVAVPPLADGGDPRMPPPQEGDPLMGLDQLPAQPLFQEIDRLRCHVPGRMRPDRGAVHVERGRDHERSFERRIELVLHLDPAEQDRSGSRQRGGTHLALRVRDHRIVDPCSGANHLEIEVRHVPAVISSDTHHVPLSP